MTQIDPTLVLLANYRSVSETIFARSILESAGIESFLNNSNIVQMYGLIPDAFGGVRLFVRADEFEAAASFLKQSDLEKPEGAGIGEFVQPHCPGCKSTDVSFSGPEKPGSDESGFIGLQVSESQKNSAAQFWECHACGHKWKESNPELPLASGSEAEK